MPSGYRWICDWGWWAYLLSSTKGEREKGFCEESSLQNTHSKGMDLCKLQVPHGGSFLLAEGLLEDAVNRLRHCPRSCYKPFPVFFHFSPVQTARCKGQQWLAVQHNSFSVSHKPWQSWKHWFHVVGTSKNKCTVSMLLVSLKKGWFSPISPPVCHQAKQENFGRLFL